MVGIRARAMHCTTGSCDGRVARCLEDSSVSCTGTPSGVDGMELDGDTAGETIERSSNNDALGAVGCGWATECWCWQSLSEHIVE